MPLQEILKTKGKQKTSQTIRQAISIRSSYFASILFSIISLFFMSFRLWNGIVVKPNGCKYCTYEN